jgi:hypothetical protein
MTTMSGRELAVAVDPALNALGVKYMLDPETGAIGKAAGYPRGFPFYMAGRGGVLGDVDPDVVYAAFMFFDKELVTSAWNQGIAVEGPGPASRRYAGAADAWAVANMKACPELPRFTELATHVVERVDSAGLTLFAGLRALGLPDGEVQRAYRLATYMRELRGCVHMHAVRAQGLTALQAMLASSHGERMAGLHGYQPPYPDCSHLVAKRERAEALTDELMGDIYESTLSDVECGEFARVVAAVVGAQQSS